MLTKEKLSEIFNKAIGTRNYVCKIEQSSSKNGCAIKLCISQPNDDEWVATIYVSEVKTLGSFNVSFIPGRNSKTDREVLRMINSQLFEYFVKQLEPKYYIKLLNNDYGYLTLDEDAESWDVTSIDIAKANHQKTTFTADEINEMSKSEEFANVDLWSAAVEVEDYD